MSPLLFLSKKKKKKYAFNVSGSLSLFPFTDNSSSLPPSGIRQTSPSSAPWVTYINPVVSAPHIDTSQRIRQTSRWWQSTADMEMCHRERLHLFMHSKEDRPAIQCMSLPEHWASPNSPFTKATTHPPATQYHPKACAWNVHLVNILVRFCFKSLLQCDQCVGFRNIKWWSWTVQQSEQPSHLRVQNLEKTQKRRSPMFGLSILGYCKKNKTRRSNMADTKQWFLFSGEHNYEYSIWLLPKEPPNFYTLDFLKQSTLTSVVDQSIHPDLLPTRALFLFILRGLEAFIRVLFTPWWGKIWHWQFPWAQSDILTLLLSSTVPNPKDSSCSFINTKDEQYICKVNEARTSKCLTFLHAKRLKRFSNHQDGRQLKFFSSTYRLDDEALLYTMLFESLHDSRDGFSSAV